MAVKANATITISFMVDVKAVYRYYKLQASTASAPAVPTTATPSDWTDSEPTYTEGSTNTLYTVDKTVFSNDTFVYSAVSKSTSYEAAKAAYNKAVAANTTANSSWEAVNELETDAGIDSDVAYIKDIPSNAQDWADLQMLGGKSVVMNQLFCKTAYSGTSNGITYEYADGVMHIYGTSTAESYSNFNGISTEYSGHLMMLKAHFISGYDSNLLIRDGYTGSASSVTQSAPIKVYTASANQTIQFYIPNTNITVDCYFRLTWVDLTKMFGSGSEPTIDECKQIFTADYYQYNEGSVINAPVDKVVSVGKNLLNESTNLKTGYYGSSSAYMNRTTNSKYRCFSMFLEAGTYTVSVLCDVPIYLIRWADDASGRVTNISITANTKTITLDNDATIYFSFRNSTTTDNYPNLKVQVEKGSSATSYSPYTKNETAIPQALKSLNGYGWGVGSVFNELSLVPKKYSNMKSVDLGSLEWEIATNGSSNFFLSRNISSANYKGLCSKYASVDEEIVWYNTPNGFIYVRSDKSQLIVNDTTYSTATDFKNAMNGVILHYEATSGGSDYNAYLYTKRVGKVDLGSLTYSGSGGLYAASIADIKTVPNNDTLSNLLCGKYTAMTRNELRSSDKAVSLQTGGTYVIFQDSAYTDATSFKNSLNGVNLWYELATPQIYDVTDLVPEDLRLIEVEGGGTLTFHSSDTYNSPVPSVVHYLGNATAARMLAVEKSSAAAKTATNYMDFQEGTGLVIGNMTDSTLGANVCIDSDSVDIRKGTKVAASFTEDGMRVYDTALYGGVILEVTAESLTTEGQDSWRAKVEAPLRELSIGAVDLSAINSRNIELKTFEGRVYIHSTCPQLEKDIRISGDDVWIEGAVTIDELTKYKIPVSSTAVNCNSVPTEYSSKIYCPNNSTNRPVNVNGWLETKTYYDATNNKTYQHQMYTTYTGFMFERTNNAGSWGDWVGINCCNMHLTPTSSLFNNSWPVTVNRIGGVVTVNVSTSITTSLSTWSSNQLVCTLPWNCRSAMSTLLNQGNGLSCPFWIDDNQNKVYMKTTVNTITKDDWLWGQLVTAIMSP